MKWIELTKDNIPVNEVLCANFKEGSHGYKQKIIGYIDHVHNYFQCENDNEVIYSITHFIDINKFDL